MAPTKAMRANATAKIFFIVLYPNTSSGATSKFVIIVPLSIYERQLGQVTPWALFYQDFLALTTYLDNIQSTGQVLDAVGLSGIDFGSIVFVHRNV